MASPRTIFCVNIKNGEEVQTGPTGNNGFWQQPPTPFAAHPVTETCETPEWMSQSRAERNARRDKKTRVDPDDFDNMRTEIISIRERVNAVPAPTLTSEIGVPKVMHEALCNHVDALGRHVAALSNDLARLAANTLPVHANSATGEQLESLRVVVDGVLTSLAKLTAPQPASALISSDIAELVRRVAHLELAKRPDETTQTHMTALTQRVAKLETSPQNHDNTTTSAVSDIAHRLARMEALQRGSDNTAVIADLVHRLSRLETALPSLITANGENNALSPTLANRLDDLTRRVEALTATGRQTPPLTATDNVLGGLRSRVQVLAGGRFDQTSQVLPIWGEDRNDAAVAAVRAEQDKLAFELARSERAFRDDLSALAEYVFRRLEG